MYIVLVAFIIVIMMIKEIVNKILLEKDLVGHVYDVLED